MIDPGTRQPLYGWEMVEQVNAEVLHLAPILVTLRSIGIYLIGDDEEVGPHLPFGKTPFTEINAEKAFVGFFEDPEGTTWAMLVNRRHGKYKSAAGQSSAIQVFCDQKVSRIIEIDRLTGHEREILVDRDSFLVSIPGGTGSLLRIEMKGQVK